MATDTSPGPSTSGGSLPARQGHQGSSGSSDTHASRGGQGTQGSQWALWFGLFGGVAAWTLHLAIAYPLVYNGCALGLDQLSTWLLILTAVLAAVALLATIAAFFTWRAFGAQASSPATSGAEAHAGAQASPPAVAPGGMLGSRRLLGLMGMGLSGLSLLIMIFSAIAITGLGPCYYR
ncbi:MAG: hypothetical protein U0X20_16250 [Caldilineaceae bacterium]